jgi:hypothetical protein
MKTQASYGSDPAVSSRTSHENYVEDPSNERRGPDRWLKSVIRHYGVAESWDAIVAVMDEDVRF